MQNLVCFVSLRPFLLAQTKVLTNFIYKYQCDFLSITIEIIDLICLTKLI